MDDLSETPAQRWARTAADDAFPHFAGRGWDGYALAENVFAGWRVSVSCCACGHKAEFGARAIAKLGAHAPPVGSIAPMQSVWVQAYRALPV